VATLSRGKTNMPQLISHVLWGINVMMWAGEAIDRVNEDQVTHRLAPQIVGTVAQPVAMPMDAHRSGGRSECSAFKIVSNT
jgi:hypothetical protein